MELEWADFRFSRVLTRFLTLSSALASGPGRRCTYLIDPVRQQLIALKQWEMLSLPPPPFFFPPSTVLPLPAPLSPSSLLLLEPVYIGGETL